MRGNGLAAGLAGLLLALGWLGVAQAQPVPPGSYLRSCTNVDVRQGRNLVAACATRAGNYMPARLDDFPSCRGDISNQNGQLWCERRPAPPPGPGPMPMPPGPHGFGPPGSYQQTCTRIAFKNGLLAAFCRTRQGDWQPTSLNTLLCQPGTDISNQNGVLFCPPRPALVPPPGSYVQSCRDATLGGAGMLRAVCRTINGQWVPAQLNVRLCRPGRDIANLNGRLACN